MATSRTRVHLITLLILLLPAASFIYINTLQRPNLQGAAGDQGPLYRGLPLRWEVTRTVFIFARGDDPAAEAEDYMSRARELYPQGQVVVLKDGYVFYDPSWTTVDRWAIAKNAGIGLAGLLVLGFLIESLFFRRRVSASHE